MFHKIYHKIRNFRLIKKYPTLKEIMKYSLVGNFSNLVDFSIYIFLTRFFSFWHEHYLVVNIFSMLSASFIRFFLHKRWTFRNTDKDTHIQYLKLIVLLTIGLFLNEAVLYVSVEHFTLNDLLGKFIAIVIGTILVYYFTRTWVFNKSGIKFKSWHKF